MVWDREHPRSGEPNHLVVNAINLILTQLARNQRQTIQEWNNRGIEGEQLYPLLVNRLTTVREHARRPGATTTEDEYQTIGLALYFLYVDERAGLSVADISNMHQLLGLESGQAEGAWDFDDILTSSILTGLAPGRIAQVGWFVRTGQPDSTGQFPVGHHVFLIGRFRTGEWFLSDQGPQPPTEITAPDFQTLRARIIQESQQGRYWLYTGQLVTRSLGWTGVRLIGEAQGLTQRAAELIPTNTFLAEVDSGVLPWQIGEQVRSGPFVSRRYSLGEAERAATNHSSGAGNVGAVIVEMPENVYSIYQTNRVNDRNYRVTEIDRAEGGLLTRQTFYSARLLLCNGSQTRLLEVY
jgi:hypothetical protein